MTTAPFTETHRETLIWTRDMVTRGEREAIDAALAEIDRLETERNQIEQKAMEWCHATQEARAEIDRLTAENERLRIEAQAVADKLQFVTQAMIRET